MTRTWVSAAVVSAVLWGACTGPTESISKDTPASADVVEIAGSDLVVFPETAAKDTGADGGLPDFQVHEATQELVPECQPGEGCFLDECTENSQCLSGWCVEHIGEGVCTTPCQEECPDGWTCEQVAGAGPDVQYLCISHFANLCRPCVESADCLATGGIEDVCVTYGEAGAFCGGTCQENTDCPWGFSCLESETAEGAVVSQCVADAGLCPCTDKSVALGLFTSCEVSNDFGVCIGKRQCTDEGLAPCDAAVPDAEQCNGEDDDCDGDVDEPFDMSIDPPVSICDDGNDCTSDSCTGADGCMHELLDAGECKDDNPCTVADHCVAGECVGTPVLCDDNNPCTNDICDETGGCVFENNFADCDDEDPCTVGDDCADGVCSGFAVACDCVQDADCAVLEDGDLCNGTLFCNTQQVPYQCAIAEETIIDCPQPDGLSAICLKSACAPDTGECTLVPDHEGFSCDDSDLCTMGEACVAGECQNGAEVNCNDGDPCTLDTCDPAVGCIQEGMVGPCDDGDECTLEDECVDGVCMGGKQANCNDLNSCTEDSCDPAVGCIHVPVDGACEDGNFCTTGDHCVDGLCLSTGMLDCEDHNPCTADSCDQGVGCLHELLEGPCNDGNYCTIGESCQLGACVGGMQVNCADNNPCTTEECIPEEGCVYEMIDGLCSDGDECTQGDHCAGGACVFDEWLICEDDNSCTNDQCDPLLGCVYEMNSSPCSDGDLCTTGDLCQLGQCQAGPPLVCDDQNACTDDGCSPLVGCEFVPNQSQCDDNNECTTSDQCSGGWCQGAVVICNDGNPCTDDLCDATDGCHFDLVENGTACGVLNGWDCQDGQCLCAPDCEGLNCGSDGCGSECGACAPGWGCMAGICVEMCSPDCTGKECGDNGCGGSCGICDDGFNCDAGTCVPGCETDCTGKECGDDGCGGSCGACPEGCFCGAGACSCAPEEICGLMEVDTTWPEGFEYLVTCDVLVAEDTLLAIEKGVTVKFDGNYKLRIDGMLTVDGTEDQRVTFTGAKKFPSKGDWYGIEFKSSSHEDSRITYANIQFASYGIRVESNAAPTISNNVLSQISNTAIQIQHSDSDVTYNEISGCERGIELTDSPGGTQVYAYNVVTECQYGAFMGWLSSGSVDFHDNEFRNNQFGLYWDDVGAALDFYDNIIEQNTSYGIYIGYMNNGADVHDIKIVDNNIGIYLNNGQDGIHIYNSEIHGSSEYDVKLGGGFQTNKTFHAVENWWGTTDSDEIDAHIWDYRDKYELGHVLYSPLLVEIGGEKNSLPTVEANLTPILGEPPLEVTFTGSATDPDLAGIASYQWDWEGDGQFDFESPDSGNTTHTYAQAGNYIPTLMVTDGDGLTAKAKLKLSVVDPAVPVEMCGMIETDMVWPAGFTFLITCDLLVTDDTSLTIQPGVTVKFDGNYKLRVDGMLIADGTAGEPIVFTGAKAFPNKGDWYGIEFKSSSHEDSSITYSEIKFASYGIRVESNAAPTISHNTITQISNTAIQVQHSDSDVTYNTISGCERGIELTDSPGGTQSYVGNVVTECQYGAFMGWLSSGVVDFSGNEFTANQFGLYWDDVGAALDFYDNVIQNNTSYGIYIGYMNSGADVHDNIITDNNIAIYLNNGQDGIHFYNNQIFGSAEFDVKLGGGFQTQKNFHAVENWWGTTDSDTIDSHIWDYKDKYELGHVIYSPLLTTEIGPKNALPTVEASLTPILGEPPLLVTFTGAASDPDGQGITIYEWDWEGDGQFDWQSAGSANTTHAYEQAGNFIPTLRVTDGDGLQSKAKLKLSVVDPAVPVEMCGLIENDMTWPTGLTFLVTCDILVSEGTGLTIEPNVTVKFDGNYKLRIDGMLKADGTADQPIVFTGAKTFPSKGDWYGIEFKSSSHEDSSISHSEIKFASYGIRVESNAAPTISNNTITQISNTAIQIQHSDSDVTDNTISGCERGIELTDSPGGTQTFTGNVVTDCQYGAFMGWLSSGVVEFSDNEFTGNQFGLYWDDVGGALNFHNNLIQQNTSYGIYIGYMNSGADVHDCTITDNNIGIYLNNGQDGIAMYNCIISESAEYNVKLGGGFQTQKTFKAGQNWWGTTDAAAIDEKIWDYEDKFELGQVEYLPILGEAPF